MTWTRLNLQETSLGWIKKKKKGADQNQHTKGAPCPPEVSISQALVRHFYSSKAPAAHFPLCLFKHLSLKLPKIFKEISLGATVM